MEREKTLWAVIDDDPKLEPLPRNPRMLGAGQAASSVYSLPRDSKYRYVRRVPSTYATNDRGWPKSALKKSADLSVPFKKDGAMEEGMCDDTASTILPEEYNNPIYLNYSGSDARQSLNDSGVSSNTSHSEGPPRRTNSKPVVTIKSPQAPLTNMQPYGPAFGIERLYDDAYTAF